MECLRNLKTIPKHNGEQTSECASAGGGSLPKFYSFSSFLFWRINRPWTALLVVYFFSVELSRRGAQHLPASINISGGRREPQRADEVTADEEKRNTWKGFCVSEYLQLQPKPCNWGWATTNALSKDLWVCGLLLGLGHWFEWVISRFGLVRVLSYVGKLYMLVITE